MSAASPLAAIVDGAIRVVPEVRRAAVFAALARSRGTPLLQRVTDGGPFTDDPAANDVCIGLYERRAEVWPGQLSGLAILRERMPRPGWSVPTALDRGERMFVIETLITSRDLLDWHPPVIPLLMATAATLVATVYHDPSICTFVACRVPAGERNLEEAAAAIGAAALPIRHVGHRLDALADVPNHELRFLDGRAAARAIRLVVAHLDGEVQPVRPSSVAASWNRRLTVTFPVAFRHLAEEMGLIASGRIDLGWTVPMTADNDVERELPHAAGI